jgi:hypothetical protein
MGIATHTITVTQAVTRIDAHARHGDDLVV